MARPLRDITGLPFSELTVIQRTDRKQGTNWLWECRCRCGNTVYLQAGALTRSVGPTRSCGCLRAYEASERAKARAKTPEWKVQTKKAHEASVTHGMTRNWANKRHPEYQAWVDMKQRCYNPKHRSFPHYGGRGISVCPEWYWSFEQFYADVGPRPGPDYSLDRYPNNNGNYEPNNCRWATWKEQNNNRRKRMLF